MKSLQCINFSLCLPLKLITNQSPMHRDLCAIESSLVDASTALKHGDETCLYIWHLTSNLYVMCITESINIDSHQANLKAFIQHYKTTQNGHYTSTIKKGTTVMSQIKETKLNQEINDAYILFYMLI